MTEPKTAEEWGRLAVSIPGWRWMVGMLSRNFDGPVRVESVDGTQPGILRWCRYTDEAMHADIRSAPVPDPDDPATAGCLLALLGNPEVVDERADHLRRDECYADVVIDAVMSGTPGRISRACIAAAGALGRWPGGEG